MPDIKWVATSLVSLVVVIIVIATVAVPVIEDQTVGPQISGKNTGYEARFTDLTKTAFTYTMDTEGNASFTVGGVQHQSPAAYPSLLLGDQYIIRQAANDRVFIYSLESSYLTMLHEGTGGIVTVSYQANGNYVITAKANAGDSDDDALILSDGTNTKTVLASSTDGPIGAFNSPISATIGATVYAGAFDVSNRGPIRFTEIRNGAVVGDVFSPFVFTNYDSTAGTADLVSSDVSYTVSYSVAGDSQQVGKYTGLTSTYTQSGSTVNNTEYTWYAPIDYVSTSAEAGAGGTNAVLLGIVPLMLFIVAIMMAVRVMQQAH